MTDREATWRQGFKTLSSLKLTQAELQTGFFRSGGVQVISKHGSRIIYSVLFISHKMHRAEVKHFILQ